MNTVKYSLFNIMNFVLHELIQLSNVINNSEREAGSFEARQTKRSSYVRFMYVCPHTPPNNSF